LELVIVGTAIFLFNAAALAADTEVSAAKPSSTSTVTVLRDIPYVFMTLDGVMAKRQSLDLYLPITGKHKPPLVAFVHGGFWSLTDDAFGIGPAFAQALATEGVAVALIRYRLAPPSRFPDNAEDVARAVAHLQRVAGKYGYDAKKLFLAGHSAGAHLTSLVALDEKYLHAAGAQPVAGVIAVSGIYDLTATGPLARRKKEILDPVFGSDEQTLRTALPVTHVRQGPPFLILSAENDFPGFQPDARRFAAALRVTGHGAVQEIIVPAADHSTIMNFERKRNPARELVLEFVGVAKASPVVSVLAQARRVWQEPPYSTEPFWQYPDLVRRYPVDDRFRAALKKIYEYTAFELKSYPLQAFHAIDLDKFLATQPPEKIGKGDYLVLTNVRGEKVFWKRQQIEPYQPVIVVGLDDEHNLFRLTVFYQNRLEYSWKPDTPYMMARSVGAFIHFLKPPPAELQPPTASMYALTAESFRLFEDDPLERMADLPKDVHDVMYYRNACFSCHGFRGTDVRAGHVRARNGEVSGGFALPLESYPPEVFRRFMFEQDKSAAMMGVRPNTVAGPAARRLHDLVVTERDRVADRQPGQ
jgi:acetyl esterase/lipase